MMCAMCLRDTESHSFFPLTTLGDKTVFYTNIGRNKDIAELDAIVGHMAELLEPLKAREIGWIWVVDCRGFTARHAGAFGVATSVSKIIRDRYSDLLHCTYILNASPTVNGLVTALMPLFAKDAMEKMQWLRGSPLELYVEFQKKGWGAHEVAPLIRELRKE